MFGPQRERNRAYAAARRGSNAEKYRAVTARRRAAKLRATPSWADHQLIAEIYAEARYQGLVVDHIVPLRGKTVCGLHWEGNLQLLTAQENSRKGNSLASLLSNHPCTTIHNPRKST